MMLCSAADFGLQHRSLWQHFTSDLLNTRPIGHRRCRKGYNDEESMNIIEAPAESWTPICFHILAERGVWWEYLEMSKRLNEPI